MDLKITPSARRLESLRPLVRAQTTDTKLLIYGLFQKGRVLAQDGIGVGGPPPCEPLGLPVGGVYHPRGHLIAKPDKLLSRYTGPVGSSFRRNPRLGQVGPHVRAHIVSEAAMWHSAD